MDAHVRAVRNFVWIIIPQLRRLRTRIPRSVRITRAKDALFGANSLLVATNAEDDAAIALPRQQRLESGTLTCGVACGRRKRWIDGVLRRALFVNDRKAPIADDLVAKLVDFRELHSRIEQHHW